MSDDELLAAVLRRFLKPGEPVDDDDDKRLGYYTIWNNHLTIDTGVDVSDDEFAALLRAAEGHASNYDWNHEND